jgi:hypothetical protein
MSLDRRLRDGLSMLAAQVEPDVDRHLHLARRKARRAVVRWRAGAALALAGALAASIIVADSLSGWRGRSLPPAGQPATTPSSTTENTAIAGTYTRAVPAGGADVATHQLAGRWTLALRSDGSATVTAPAAFTGVLSGVLFNAQGNTFRTNLFVQDVCSNLPMATYRWIRMGNRLALTPVDDQCAGRVAVLASDAWLSAG